MSRLRTTTMRVIHDEDPKTVIEKAMKPIIAKVKPTGHSVIICMYERTRATGNREKKTAGGIIVPGTADVAQEDAIQGNVGLVVALGPNVGAKAPDLGFKIEVGMWAMFRQSDAMAFVMASGKEGVADFHMRELEVQMIRVTVDDPDMVI